MSTTTKLNVAKAADDFLDSICEGFNGVSIDSAQKECCWHEEYAIFLLYWDLCGIDDGDTQYHSFDWDKLRADFDVYLRNHFPGCDIRVSCQGCEYEICGPGYKEFYKKHMDRLEELECTLKKSCHWVYHPEKAGEAQMEKRKAYL